MEKIQYLTYGKCSLTEFDELSKYLKKQCEQTMAMTIKEFPKISHKCNVCGGSGKEDVSYHGSAMYEDCYRCKGKKDVIYYREMTVYEKLDYLLKLITDLN